MKRKGFKRLLNLIAFSVITVSAVFAGCHSVSLTQNSAEPKIKEEITLPEVPSAGLEIPDAEPEISSPEGEIAPPVIKLPDTPAPPAKAEGTGGQAEVYAQFEYTPVDDEHCAVSCINKDAATYAEIPLQASIDGKVYYVREIAERGFENCPRLKTVDVGYNVRIINDFAFFKCSNLESVLINETFGMVTEIGYDAFAHNYKLKEINLSDVRKIDDVAFINCKSLTSVNAPLLTEIGVQAFIGCENLESVYIPNAKNIKNCAFGSCPKLSEIVIPRSAEVLGNGVFYNNSTQVKLAKGVDTKNWDRSWNSNNSVTEVIENWVVQAELAFTPINDYECSVKCTNREAVMHAEIPSTAVIDGKEYSVTEIASHGFYNSAVLESFVLPDSVKVIGSSAFTYCGLLNEISLSDLTLIDSHAFSYCDNLTNVEIDNVVNLGRAFYDCANLKSVKISNVTEIGNIAFAVSKALESADLTNIDKIGRNVFINCTGLTEVNLDNVNEIGLSVFSGCTNLSKVNLTDVKSIGRNAFANCTGLKDIIIPESVTTMGSGVFFNCDTQIKVIADNQPEGWHENWNNGNANQNAIWGWFEGKGVFGYTAIEGTENCSVYCLNKDEVTFAEIPSTAIIDGKEYTVTEIANSAFSRCEKLERVNLPSTVKVIGESAFGWNNELTAINLTDVTNIKRAAFVWCKSLKEADLSDTVNIEDACFGRCEALEKVYMPNVREIGNTVFAYCLTLSEVIIPSTAVQTGKTIFRGCNTQIKAIAQEKPEGWDIDWNNGNQNQNVIWSWFEGKAVFGYTATDGAENCSVYCLNKDQATYAEIPQTAIIDGQVYNVTSIAEGGFENCGKLRTVIFPVGLSSIGSNAFSNCKALNHTVIPQTVTSMGGNVFNGCTARLYVVAEEKPSGWADNWNGDDADVVWGWKDALGRFDFVITAEGECEVSLINKVTATEAYIPETVTIEGKEYKVTAIADGGFSGSLLLKKVVVPCTLKKIGSLAFCNCPELESFSLYNVQIIESGAFKNCSKLDRLFIPKSAAYVGSGILSGNDTKVFARPSTDEGWAQGWNAGNSGKAEFDSKFILPIEIYDWD